LDVQDMAATFAAAGDPVRLRLLRYLLDEERTVSQCTQHVGLAQSGVSKHLAKLVEAGLVTRTQVGRNGYHRVRHRDLVIRLLEVGSELTRD
jgi:DNA-binding transcriptional ArsR family regulator